MLNPGINLGIISCHMVRTRRQYDMLKNTIKTLSKFKMINLSIKMSKKSLKSLPMSKFHT